MTEHRRDEPERMRDLDVTAFEADDVKGGRDQVEEPTNFNAGADSENPNPSPAPAYGAGVEGTLQGIFVGIGRLGDKLIPRF